MAQRIVCGLVFMFLLVDCQNVVRAQALIKIVDDVIAVTSKGSSKQQKARTHQHLAGAGESAMPAGPGSDQPRMGERGYAPRESVVSAATREYHMNPAAAARHIAPGPPSPVKKARIYGPLELPSEEDEGPPDGLTLDAAIDRLIVSNYDLRTKFQELPKAQADVLSAGLRNNPFLFASTDGIPYGNYTPQRPGAVNYEATVAQPIDLNHKRRVRIRVAYQAKRVLDAQYQDAVRMEIDRLYTAYVDTLEAREAVRAAHIGFDGLAEVFETTRRLVERGQAPQTELDRASIQKYNAQNALEATDLAFAQAKRDLATMLAMPAEVADTLQLRGSLTDKSPGLPDIGELMSLALRVRPDLAAYRLGVGRARTALELARAERFDDVFLFYTPFNIANNAPMGGQNATSWSLGTLVPLPLFNRNQGNISRAQTNIAQTRIELTGAERHVVNDVQKAAAECLVSRAAVERYDRDILPIASRLRVEKYRLFTRGEEGLASYLEAQREFNDVVRQYLEAKVRHRRNVLHLNTAVGQRVMP